jgi:hypothetical protein
MASMPVTVVPGGSGQTIRQPGAGCAGASAATHEGATGSALAESTIADAMAAPATMAAAATATAALRPSTVGPRSGYAGSGASLTLAGAVWLLRRRQSAARGRSPGGDAGWLVRRRRRSVLRAGQTVSGRSGRLRAPRLSRRTGTRAVIRRSRRGRRTSSPGTPTSWPAWTGAGTGTACAGRTACAGAADNGAANRQRSIKGLARSGQRLAGCGRCPCGCASRSACGRHALVLAHDAAVTAALLQNLGPVIASVQPAKDAVPQVGALLIAKVSWVVNVLQLMAAQQAELDHQPQQGASARDPATAEIAIRNVIYDMALLLSIVALQASTYPAQKTLRVTLKLPREELARTGGSAPLSVVGNHD